MRHTAAAGEFTPPLKNSIYTVRVKTISKMSFLRSMGSTKKVLLTEHGKLIFEFCNPSALKRLLFFSIISAEGCQRRQDAIPTLHGNQKEMLLTEHGKQIFHFCSPSRMILTFLPELVRFWPALAGSSRLWPVFQRFWAKVVRSDPSQHAPRARMTVVNTNSFKLWPICGLCCRLYMACVQLMYGPYMACV